MACADRVRRTRHLAQVLVALLARRDRVNCEGVHATLEFAGERLVDQAMAFEPRLALKDLRHNINAEMRLSAGSMAGMPPMLFGFIDNPQALGRERAV